jgi:Flp pilus assembly protein TadB
VIVGGQQGSDDEVSPDHPTPGSTSTSGDRRIVAVALPGERKEAPGSPPRNLSQENNVTTSIPVERNGEEIPSMSAVAPAATESTDGRRSPRRETILLVGLVGLAVAVVLFGLVFPELLAPAVAVAVLAAIVALDWVLPSGELRQMTGHHWMR